jgi:signal transduction histidine kinase
MDALTRDLLAYGRVARESVTLEPVHLKPLLDSIIALHGVGNKNRAKIIIEPDLLDVMGHCFLLEQSLANLITNAAKFVSPGVVPEVRIRTEPRASHVRLWIEDNGIGIDASYHHKIFNMFERVGDLHRYEGTGIGLAIVNRAVQRMGGDCGVESAPGQGSRFWLDLPPVPPSP